MTKSARAHVRRKLLNEIFCGIFIRQPLVDTVAINKPGPCCYTQVTFGSIQHLYDTKVLLDRTHFIGQSEANKHHISRQKNVCNNKSRDGQSMLQKTRAGPSSRTSFHYSAGSFTPAMSSAKAVRQSSTVILFITRAG